MNQALLHMVMQEELLSDSNAQMELIIKNHSGKEILKYMF